MSNGRMRIVQVRAKDFKCLVEVELSPDGDVIRIAGRPGQGKTSILEAIEATIRGGDETLVRRGADHAELFLAVGDLAINRSIDLDGKQRLAVSEGGRALGVQAAKALLDGLFGEQVFRPIRWVQLSGGDSRGRTERLRKQRDELLHALALRLTETELVAAVQDLGDDALRILGEIHLDLDLDQQHGLVACESLRKACYDARSVTNRQQEEAESRLRAMPVPPPKPPNEPLAVLVARERDAEQAWQRALGAQRAQASTRARAEQLRGRLAAAAGQAPQLEDEASTVAAGKDVAREIDEIQTQIDALRKRQAALEERRETLRKELTAKRERNDATRRQAQALEQDRRELADLEKALGQSLDDPEALRRQFEQARESRTIRERTDQYSAAASAVEAAAARSRALDGLVTLFREALPQRLLGRARFPVPGLGLDGEQLTIRGVPIHRLGTADQIRLGFAVAIALNPQAGFVCVDGAESLGVEGRQALAAAAQEAHVQLWMSEVSENPEPGSIVMQAGEALVGVGAGR